MVESGSTLTPERIARARAAGWWRDDSLEQLCRRWGRERPDRTAVVDGAGRLTWGALDHAVERMAQGLAAAGLGPGDAVSCQLPNWNEWVVTALAVARLGGVLNPIPPTYRWNELRFMLGVLEARALVVPGAFRGFDHAELGDRLASELPHLRHVWVARGAPRGRARPFEELWDTPWERRSARLGGTDPNVVSEVVFTSGTTGEPKGVMHTVNTALSTVYPLVERLRFTAADVGLMSSTFGHQTGYLYGYCLTVLLGSTGVWLDVWQPERAAELIEAERVTYTMGATPFLRDLTYSAAVERLDLSSLRLFMSAGAPIPRRLVEDARARLGCAISAGWGMTENGLVTCNGLDDPPAKVFGTDGRPIPGMEVVVVDDAERPLAAGVEGDLLVRGHSQFVGYWRRPQFTAEAHTADGWFRTGDRAALDADGYVSITGRAKDLIIRGGENISVAEVEGLLFQHPKIAGVAVVAMSDPRLGERACAVVIPRPGEPPGLAELVAFLAERGVARHKFPERLELVEEFPATPSGKVQKYKLRQLVATRVAGGA